MQETPLVRAEDGHWVEGRRWQMELSDKEGLL